MHKERAKILVESLHPDDFRPTIGQSVSAAQGLTIIYPEIQVNDATRPSVIPSRRFLALDLENIGGACRSPYSDKVQVPATSSNWWVSLEWQLL